MSLILSLTKNLISNFKTKYNNELDNLILSLFKNHLDPSRYLIDNKGLIILDHNKIKNLQTILKDHNFLTDEDVDGNWNEKTYGSLVSFQVINDLPPDGKLNNETINFLNLR